MGEKDTITKEYMRNNSIFADAFNYYIYGGRQVINPDELKELDTTHIAIPFHEDSRNLKEVAYQKYRDILKSVVVKSNDDATFVILGIENQTKVHYAMPVRNAIYDALQYGEQVTKITKRNREKRIIVSDAEYLSGFRKDDKINPVITLVIHFGQEAWDGPMSLHEMMGKSTHPEILKMVQDYKIHLIEPAKMSKDEMMKFRTSLREVMGCIKYSKEKESFEEYLHNNPRMVMEVSAARVIRAITNTKFDIPEKEEVVDVCQAVDEMMQEKFEQGVLKGEAIGRFDTFIELLNEGILTSQEVAERMEMTEDELQEILKNKKYL